METLYFSYDIKNQRNFVPFRMLLMLCRSLISPYLIYGLTVWGQDPQIYLNQILVLQRRTLRLIEFGSLRSPVIPPFVFFCSLPIVTCHLPHVLMFTIMLLGIVFVLINHRHSFAAILVYLKLITWCQKS